MRIHWIDLLACPACQRSLRLIDEEATRASEITEGTLECLGCRSQFPVAEDIVGFGPVSEVATPEDALKQSEIKKRDAQASAYDSMLDRFYTEVEAASLVDGLQPDARDVVAELGIGTGRIAQAYARRVRGLLGVDFSRASLLIARQRLQSIGTDFCLLHADICRLPIKDGSVSKAVSPQVFEHLPSWDLRHQGLAEARRILVPGGKLVLSVYNHSLVKRVKRRLGPGEDNAKEGRHSGQAIYYYNFDCGEFKAFLARHFQVDGIRGIIAEIPGLSRLGRLRPLLERAIQRTPLGFATGHLLLARAHKTSGNTAQARSEQRNHDWEGHT